MEQIEYYLGGVPCLSLPVADADRLLTCSNLQCLKLYLYLLRAGRSVPLQRISEDLGIPTHEVTQAAKELKSMGLLGVAGKGTPTPEQAIPEYGKSYLAARSREDKLFVALQTEAANVLGHTLSAQELNTLFGIYDYLGMPGEVIMMLFSACAEDVRERYGPGRTPTMRQIEKQAYIWANREIMTFEQAEEYLTAQRNRKDKLQEVKRALGIWDRKLSDTETRYMTDWLDKGFDTEAISLAFDRTVTQIGSMKMAYMNKIILNWHEKGLHTLSEIMAGDEKPQSKTSAKPAPAAAGTAPVGEKERLMKLFGDLSK